MPRVDRKFPLTRQSWFQPTLTWTIYMPPPWKQVTNIYMLHMILTHYHASHEKNNFIVLKILKSLHQIKWNHMIFFLSYDCSKILAPIRIKTGPNQKQNMDWILLKISYKIKLPASYTKQSTYDSTFYVLTMVVSTHQNDPEFPTKNHQFQRQHQVVAATTTTTYN